MDTNAHLLHSTTTKVMWCSYGCKMKFTTSTQLVVIYEKSALYCCKANGDILMRLDPNYNSGGSNLSARDL